MKINFEIKSLIYEMYKIYIAILQLLKLILKPYTHNPILIFNTT